MGVRLVQQLLLLVVVATAILCAGARALSTPRDDDALELPRGRSLWSTSNLELCKLSWDDIEAQGSRVRQRRCHRLIHNFCRRPRYLAFLRSRKDEHASAQARLDFCNGLLYEPDVCPKHLAVGIAVSMSACEAPASIANNLDQNVICSQVTDFSSCYEMDGCVWRELVPGGGDDDDDDDASRVAGSGGNESETGDVDENDDDDESDDDDDRRALQNQPGAVCVADPCYRINNGRCTIQHTGGRCVWYTQEQNLALRGIDNAGCYPNPCHNVKKQRRCEKWAGNDFYKCVWCGRMDGTPYGCQAARSESYAQCFNIGAYEERCSECMPRRRDMHVAKLNADCTKQKCAQQCCDSPYCTCGQIRTTENTGLNIITGGR